MEISHIRNVDDAFAAGLAKSLGKRIGKAVGQAGEASATLVTFLSEMFKGSKIIRIYQKKIKFYQMLIKLLRM